MKVGIIGSGGREHALCHSISKSKKVEKIYCIPGNAGTHKIAENINLDINNFDILKKFINENNIDIIIVGPEKPLVDGIVDFLEANKIKVFGPNKLAQNLKVLKYSQKNCVKKIIFQLRNLEFSIIMKAIDFLIVIFL